MSHILIQVDLIIIILQIQKLFTGIALLYTDQSMCFKVGLFHKTERYRPKPVETGPKNTNRGPINYIYTIV